MNQQFSRLTSNRALLGGSVVALFLGVLAPTGCSEPGSSTYLTGGGGSSSGGGGGGVVSSCKKHEPGCACSQEAAAEECHINRGKYGTFYDCAVGQQTCVSGQWSACIATGAAGKFVELPPGSLVPADDGTGVHTAGLASGADCATPCSPGCTAYVDTATGLDAGPGLSVGEGGVAPTGVVVQSSACTSLALTPPTTTLVVDQLAPLRLTTGNDTFSLSAALLPAAFRGRLRRSGPSIAAI